VTQPDVLVVGAGPTGLTMAAELLRHGVSCRIIDREPARHRESRATDIHPRTLELFQDLGVLGDVLARARKRTSISMFSNGDRFLHVPLEGADTPYCFMLGLEQSEVEAILEAHLEELGGKVERDVRFAGFRQHDDGVDAALLHADHSWEEPRFRWLVGCDGAHSAVRAGLEMALEGSTFEEKFLLADVKVSWDVPSDDEVLLYTSDHGVLLVLALPGDGWVRLFGDIGPDEDPPLDLDTCDRIVRERIGTTATFHELGWMTTFRVHTRMAREYRRRRVFLAGDAAHIHSPVGGHGMNLGIQDAYNLAWKLGLTCRGRAHPDLLDTYQTERRPVAKAILEETDLETRMSLWKNRLAKGAVNTLFGLIGKIGPVRRKMIAGALETTVCYPDSPLVGEHRTSVLTAPVLHSDGSEAASLGDRSDFGDGPGPGDHIRDVALDPGDHGAATLLDLVRGGRHTLLLFDGHAPTEQGYDNLTALAAEVERRYGDLVRVHVVVPAAERPGRLTWRGSVVLGANQALHARYGAAAECAYVLRPDRYVGFRSQPADRDAVLGHLARVFG
jgi:2-polyprenyl-6-methoxyphenol hydroxylase-like FAD-dependent oxidoreductase